MTANDHMVGGEHYRPGSTYQHWDYVRDCLKGRYLEGCITKYVSRHRYKNGLDDLKKAYHYLEKLIEDWEIDGPMLTSDATIASTVVTQCERFIEGQRLIGDERQIVRSLSSWRNVGDLHYCAVAIRHLIGIHYPNAAKASTQI